MLEDKITLLTLASNGLSNKEIAVELELSERSIKNYFSIIYKEMKTEYQMKKAPNRTHAVAMALRKGIIEYSDIQAYFNESDFQYELKEGFGELFVIITDVHTLSAITLTKSLVKLAIENTKTGKAGYVTQEAYDKALKMYEDALRVFGNE